VWRNRIPNVVADVAVSFRHRIRQMKCRHLWGLEVSGPGLRYL
jgi:hypothetical protein